MNPGGLAVEAVVLIIMAVVVGAFSYWATARERAAPPFKEVEQGRVEARRAGFWIRVAARTADALPLSALLAAVFAVAAFLEAIVRPAAWAWPLAFASALALSAAYFTMPAAKSGQTWGKRLAGLVAEKERGDQQEQASTSRLRGWNGGPPDSPAPGHASSVAGVPWSARPTRCGFSRPPPFLRAGFLHSLTWNGTRSCGE